MAKETSWGSRGFGLALSVAGVVLYDAMGVRRAAGEQAKVLNRLVFDIPLLHGWPKKESDGMKPPEEKPAPLLDKELKEYLGHTPLEVSCGVLLGILVAVFMPVV